MLTDLTAENAKRPSLRSFYKRIKRPSPFRPASLRDLLSRVDPQRIHRIGEELSGYLVTNLPTVIKSKRGLRGYRTNPYVLITSASSMKLSEMDNFASFLFNSKLYAGLETSFGKSIESELLQFYPTPESHWDDPPEKVKEAEQLKGLSSEEKARRRDISVWREIDKSYVIGDRRFLLMIKSGPNCINDTQVNEMKNAIVNYHKTWLQLTEQSLQGVSNLDIVIGLTYGTEKTTNNKENQILVKLIEHGFSESQRPGEEGILLYNGLPQVRVYREVGRYFWALVGNPADPQRASHVFLEVLLGLIAALKRSEASLLMEDLVNKKIAELSRAISRLTIPKESLPGWMREDYTETELTWLMSAMSAFFDEGI